MNSNDDAIARMMRWKKHRNSRNNRNSTTPATRETQQYTKRSTKPLANTSPVSVSEGQKLEKSSDSSGVSKAESFIRGALQGLTFGSADEIEAGLNAALTGQSFHKALGNIREEYKLSEDTNPWSYGIGEWGTVLIPGLGPLKVAKGGSMLLGKTLQHAPKIGKQGIVKGKQGIAKGIKAGGNAIASGGKSAANALTTTYKRLTPQKMQHALARGTGYALESKAAKAVDKALGEMGNIAMRSGQKVADVSLQAGRGIGKGIKSASSAVGDTALKTGRYARRKWDGSPLIAREFAQESADSIINSIGSADGKDVWEKTGGLTGLNLIGTPLRRKISNKGDLSVFFPKHPKLTSYAGKVFDNATRQANNQAVKEVEKQVEQERRAKRYAAMSERERMQLSEKERKAMKKAVDEVENRENRNRDLQILMNSVIH